MTIETTARVLRVEGDWAVVAADDTATCPRCAAQGGCGAAKLTQALCIRPREYKLHFAVPVQAGDRVLIAVAEGALWRSALAVYLVPLALLIGAAALGQALAPGQSRDLAAGIGFLAGALGAAAWLVWFQRHWAKRLDLRPVISRAVPRVL